MNSLQLIKSLVQLVETYENESINKNELSIEGFLSHFEKEGNIDHLKNSLIGKPSQLMASNPSHRENNIERVISQHLLFLYRYIKFYSKMAFSNSKIKSVEEFGMLVTVMQQETITKSELIKRNIIDKSAGIEIINRLIKMQLMIQSVNPNDQRSQLIHLTDSGKMELYQLFGKMDQLGKIATGELSDTEKIHLAQMLKKLDHFHYENYTDKAKSELEDYLPQS